MGGRENLKKTEEAWFSVTNQDSSILAKIFCGPKVHKQIKISHVKPCLTTSLVNKGVIIWYVADSFNCGKERVIQEQRGHYWKDHKAEILAVRKIN